MAGTDTDTPIKITFKASGLLAACQIVILSMST
jgi:hypothetical protein